MHTLQSAIQMSCLLILLTTDLNAIITCGLKAQVRKIPPLMLLYGVWRLYLLCKVTIIWASQSGTPSQKCDEWAPREYCDFFPEHVVKNRDCPGKSGMDGHLTMS